MSDLRTRIAAAITGIRIQRDGDAYAMADAVIAELGLHIDSPADGWLQAKTNMWKADDE